MKYLSWKKELVIQLYMTVNTILLHQIAYLSLTALKHCGTESNPQ